MQTGILLAARRVIDEWNKLPPQVVNAPSVNSFKSELENH